MSAFRLNIRRRQAELRPSSPVSTSSNIQPSRCVAAKPSTSAETDRLSESLFDPEDEFNVMPATPPWSVVARQSLPVRESLARTKYPVIKGRRVVSYQQITLQPPVVQPNENDSLMAAGAAIPQLSPPEAYVTAKPSCEQSSTSVAQQPWRQNRTLGHRWSIVSCRPDQTVSSTSPAVISGQETSWALQETQSGYVEGWRTN